MKQQKYLIQLISVILWATAMISVAGCVKKGENAIRTELTAVRVIKPEIRNMRESISYTGTVYSQQEVRIIAQTQGTIERLPYSEGDKVKKGDIIAEIDAPELKSRLQRARADNEYWKNRLSEDKRLVERGALALENLKVSERTAKNTEAGLSEIESMLAKSVETAPFDGIILAKNIEEKQAVMPGQVLLIIGSRDIEVRAEVVGEDIAKGIKIGLPVELNLQGTVIKSKVKDIAVFSPGISRTYRVKTDAVTDKDYPRGISAEISFILSDRQNTSTVPLNAVSDKNTKPYLYLVKDNIAIKTFVEIGIEQRGWIEVYIPDLDYEWVAVSNINQLSDGSVIFPVVEEEGR